MGGSHTELPHCLLTQTLMLNTTGHAVLAVPWKRHVLSCVLCLDVLCQTTLAYDHSTPTCLLTTCTVHTYVTVQLHFLWTYRHALLHATPGHAYTQQSMFEGVVPPDGAPCLGSSQ